MEIQLKLFKAFVVCLMLSSSLYSGIKDWGAKSKIRLMFGNNYINNEYINENYSFKKISLSSKINMKDRLKFNYFYNCTNNDERNVDSECRWLIKTTQIVVDNFFLTMGKDSVVWGRGMFFSPINYFNVISFRSKFIDKDMPTEGIDLLKLQAIWRKVSFESIYASKEKEYGNRLSFFIDNISFSLSSFYKEKTKESFIGVDFQMPFNNYTIYAEKTYEDDNQYTIGADTDMNNIFEIFKMGVEFYEKQNNQNIVAYTFIEENNFNFIYSLSKDVDYDKYNMITSLKYSFSPSFSLSISSNNEFIENQDSNDIFSYTFAYKKDMK